MTTDVSRRPAPTEANVAAGNAERRKGRKPFGSLMKRLASLKNHTNSASSSSHSRAANGVPTACSGQSPYSANYPYKGGKSASGPPSTSASAVAPSHISFGPNHHESTHSLSSTDSVSSSGSGDHSLTQTPSEGSRGRPAPSAITATTATTSAFSSPTPSVRSLTTTLTTIQSTAPGSMLDPYPHYNPHPSHHHNPHAPPMLFQHQFPYSPNGNPPTSPGPLMAMNGSLHPLNYSAATAGGLLTDDASILTLASSSKRRRRHSFDTDASVRALAPSSLWGGSRESLPLSILSGNFDTGRSIAGDRGSIYGSTSFTTARGDAASMSYAGSMREFVGGSGSIMGEISGASPLCASPHTGMSMIGNRESINLGRSSRRNSSWVKDEEEEEEDDDDGATNRRNSMSAKGDADEGEGRGGDGASMRDGSSSVGIWHGVYGKREDTAERRRKDESKN